MPDIINQPLVEQDYLLGDELLEKLLLTKEPFAGDADELFELSAWKTQNQLLQHLILYSNMLMVIPAIEGTGKTTFANQFAVFLPREFACHKIIATENLSARELQTRLVQLFSLNSVGMDTNDIVGSYLTQLNERKQHCVLIIDDAHCLSDDSIQMLFYYISRQSETAYIHFLLLGDNELVTYLEDELRENRDSVLHTINLPTLTIQEVGDYLEKRLCDAGYKEKSPFDSRNLLEIHTEASGNYNLLVQLAGRTFNQLQRVGSMKSAFNWRRYLTAGLVSTFLVVLGFSMTPLLMKEKWETHTIALPDKKIIPSHDLVKRTQPEVTISPIVRTSRLTPRAVKHSAPRKKQQVTVKKKKIVKRKKVVEVIPEPTISTQIKAIKADRKRRQAVQHVVLDSVIVLPDPKAISLSAPVDHSDHATHYVIQILASTQIDAIKTFVKQHHLSRNTKLYKSHARNVDWYTLVIGEYATREKAKHAINHLPADLKRVSPWVRTTKGLSLAHDLL